MLHEHTQELETQAREIEAPARQGKHRHIESLPVYETSPLGEDNPTEYDDGESVDVITSPAVLPSGWYEPIIRMDVTPGEAPNGGYTIHLGFTVFGQWAEDAQCNVGLNLPVAHGVFDTNVYRRAAQVNTPRIYLALLRKVRDADDLGGDAQQKPWGLWNLCREVYKVSIETPEAERNELHCTILANQYCPCFVDIASKLRAEREAKEVAAMAMDPSDPTEASSSSHTLGAMPMTNAPSNRPTKPLPRHKPRRGRQGRGGMPNPMKDASAEEWA